MKILELRFKNLNSLYGQWLIDFTAPEYVSHGIFALTGPTGAGKSTILDAVCLALYGATPRLGKITKSSNEIMSRQTGECFAEVLFESQAGRFRCHWEQRRARKKAEGKLQDQEHQISDESTGKPIETKKSLVAGVIENKTGMDFDRFTRSILLAQGGFDTFLKADVEQKSKILEQITGTEVYSEISRRVHERQREERNRLNLLEAETSGIVILEPEQEKEILQKLEAMQKEETELNGKVTQTDKAITWLVTIEGLNKELKTLADEKVKLQSDIEKFKPERDKLDRAIKAASLEGPYATLTAIRKQQREDQASLKAEQLTLPDLESSGKKHAELLDLAEHNTATARERLKAAAPLIQKVRAIDQKIIEQEKNISESKAACTKDAKKIAADGRARLKELKTKAEAEKDLELVDSYLKKHAQDEWLVSGLAGIEEQLAHLLVKQQEIVHKEAELNKEATTVQQAAKKLDTNRAQLGLCRQHFEDVSAQLQQGREKLSDLLGERVLREYHTEKETLLREMSFLAKIAKLEDYRAKLEDDMPCPLCGAREHPFASGNIPVPDATEKRIGDLTELIKAAENLETANSKLAESAAVALKKLTDSEKLEAASANEKEASETALVKLKETLEKLHEGFIRQKEAVSFKLQPLGIAEIPDTSVPSLLASLRARLKAWQQQVKRKEEVEKRLAGLESEIKRLDAVIDTQTLALAEKQQQLDQLKKNHLAATDERQKLYGDKKPDAEETLLNTAVTGTEQSEKKARIANTEMQQKLSTARTRIESLKTRVELRIAELQTAASTFSSALEPAGFFDEEQFLAARLTDENRDILSSRAKELSDAETELEAKQKDRQTRLAAELSKKPTETSLEELEKQFREYELSLQELRDTIAGFKHKLKENAAARERIRERQTAIEARKKECHRWEKLHGLIGSADGKKYRNFAQGLTFELMVSHANRQLEKMTDRYLLIRDDQQPLTLNVVDNYQAGEIRSTKNLSGGESFIVSLTLALGLSKMASRNVRVDSLFLDEGFGTLDNEALETALETLSGLQQDGKLIGIISHVSAIEERISTQITITPVSGGRSSIAGPGCRGDKKSLFGFSQRQ